jgi:membrane protease YdiL (CAAX protease family)
MFVGVHLALAFPDADGSGGLARGLAALVVSGVGLRLLLGAFDSWTRRSILTVAVMHASFNVAADFVRDDADWIRYAVTLALGLAVLTTVAVRGTGTTR